MLVEKKPEKVEKDVEAVTKTEDDNLVAKQQKQDFKQRQRPRQRQRKNDTKTLSIKKCDKSLLEKVNLVV